MSESSSKLRTKLYTEAVATISFVAMNRGDAEHLTINFLSRKGLLQHGNPKFQTLTRGRCRATTTVSYRVHGGWKSDFVKKIEADANDAGIEITDIEVILERKEMPDQCPRSECIPCSAAVARLTRGYRAAPVKDVPPENDDEPAKVDADPQRSRFSIFRRK
ncbi:MAG TPA: hypothetical protein VIY48_02750 [Candidatus Paceibacterota bacterium]